jgi:cytochrome c553
MFRKRGCSAFCRRAAIAAGTLAPLVVAGVIAAQEPDPGRAELYQPSQRDIESGRAIAVGAFTIGGAPEPQTGACFQCHGMDGRGDGTAAFPRLTDQVFKYLYDSLRDYASGARRSAIMEPIAKALTDLQMREVSAYYAAQADAPYPPPPAGDPEALQLGGALAAVGSAERGVQACMNCHGPDGIGLPPSYPYLAGQFALYLEGELKDWKTGARKGDGFGIMEEIARRLSDEEIAAVSLYYASLRPASVTPDPDEAGFPMAAAPGPATGDLER